MYGLRERAGRTERHVGVLRRTEAERSAIWALNISPLVSPVSLLLFAFHTKQYTTTTFPNPVRPVAFT